jgi:hypothetical protein
MEIRQVTADSTLRPMLLPRSLRPSRHSVLTIGIEEQFEDGGELS